MRILIADDDIGSLLVSQAVVEALGHECMTAADGERAWEMFQAERPDVLITDRSMPGMDGLELCRRVRAEQQGYTYVILLTAHGQPQDVVSGMRAGADDYLTKPLDPFGLETRLLSARRVTDLHVELLRVRAELSHQARTDPLTGVSNRLSLDAELDLLNQISTRYDRSYCVAMCDVDLFKAYNDTYGHPAGDQALRTVAATLVEQLRDVDRVYRYGGEEFVVLLPETGVDGAELAMERVRARLQSLAVEHRAGGPAGVLTLSIGVAGAHPTWRPEPSQVFAEADAALYAAKAGGRNQVTCRRFGSPQEAELVAPSDQRASR